ncbi:MAG: Ger(x)C family spore germination protein [Desulfitobacterium sp.]
MKKCLLFSLCFLLLANLLTGCWDKRELNTLAIVQAIGIDLTEDGLVSLSVQILKPSELKGGGGKAVWVVTSTGETIFDAIRNASLQTDRRLFHPHNKVIVVGEETAKKGLKPLLDFLTRDAESRGSTYVFVAKGKALDILKGEHEQEKNPAQALEHLADTSGLASNLPKRTLKDLFMVLGSKTSSLVLPGLKILTKNDEGTTKKMLVLDNTAVFKHDQLVGWFTHEESRGVLWVLNEVHTGTIVVNSPLAEDKYVSLEISQTATRLKPEITENKLSITIEVKEEGNLGEQMSDVNLTTPENFSELEKRQTAAIRDDIMTAVTKAQTWGVDLFGFGEEFHRQYPQEWPELEKEWDTLFPEIEVNLEVSAHLIRAGLTSTPLKSEPTE